MKVYFMTRAPGYLVIPFCVDLMDFTHKNFLNSTLSNFWKRIKNSSYHCTATEAQNISILSLIHSECQIMKSHVCRCGLFTPQFLLGKCHVNTLSFLIFRSSWCTTCALYDKKEITVSRTLEILLLSTCSQTVNNPHKNFV